MMKYVAEKWTSIRAGNFHDKTNVHAGSACGLAAFAAALVIASPVLLVSSQAVMAQTESTAEAQSGPILEEVLVTARKREENLLEIPESIQTFSGEMVEQANINGLSDIGLLVPNLYLSRRTDGFPNVSIRGLGGFGNTQGTGFYLDGVQLFADASSRFGDLERIEVLKGPQGILYGGANIGGAVKFVSKRPDPEAFSSTIKTRAGEDHYYDVDARVNIPLGNTWAVRVFGFYSADDGYYTNRRSPRANGGLSTADDDVSEYDEYGIRVAVAGDITERFNVYATFRWNELDGYNNVWLQELSGNFEYGDEVDFSFSPRHDRETFAATLELAYDFDWFTITSLTSYTDTDSDRDTDLDANPEFILDIFRPQRLDVITQELRFTSTHAGPWQWQVGGYLLEYRRKFDSDLLFRGGAGFLGFPLPVPPPLDATESAVFLADPLEHSHREREQYAGYANSSYRWRNFEIAGGLRVDRWEAERTNRATGESGRQVLTELLGRASLAWYSGDERHMLYVNAAQGFEPGDFNLSGFAAGGLLDFGAEHATQYEIGYKGRLFDDRVVVTLAGFLIDYRDRQFELQTTDPVTGAFVEGIINVGDSENLGVELDITYYFDDHWTLNGSLGYIDAEWDSGVISPVNGADLSGTTPPNTADFSAAGSIQFNTELQHEMRLNSRLQVRHKGSATTNAQFFDAPGDDFPFWNNPEFVVVDLGAWIEWRNWEIGLHVENIFDEDYYVDAQELPNFAGGALVNPGGVSPGAAIVGTLEQPRRVVGSIQYQF